jgi:DNA invertase Pin-like site-specific DNA recombinase
MTKIGYARVSTADQNLDAQVDALTAAGCAKIYSEKASGKLSKRPELDKALEYLREGDTLVITKLDRLGRSLKNLIQLAEDLHARGVNLSVLSMGLDTTTAAGKMFFQIIGAIAEFERELISERTREGLEAARARGRKGGRKTVMNPQKIAAARAMYDSGEHTVDAIAKTLSVSRQTIYRHLEPTA